MQSTKTLFLKLVVLLLIACLIFPLMKDVTIKAADSSIYFNDFEDGLTTGWVTPWNGETVISDDNVSIDKKSLKFTGRENTWDTPAFNMYNIIKQSGAGLYQVSIWVCVDKVDTSGQYGLFLIRGNYTNSFITDHNGNNYYRLTSSQRIIAGQWHMFSGFVSVKNEDLERTYGSFNLCFDILAPVENQNIYFDNLQIKKVQESNEELTVIPTSKTLFIGDKTVVRTNSFGDVTYMSSNTDVATVDSNGLVQAISPGDTIITVTLLGETTSCTITVKSVKDGTYFVRNVAQKTYMRLQGIGSTRKARVRVFDEGADQMWAFTYVGEGYYKIVCHSNGKALTVSNTTAGDVEGSNYIGSEEQLWKVSELDNGNYKIISKTSSEGEEHCLAIGSVLTETMPGLSVKCYNYNEIYDKEEGQWILSDCTNPQYSLFAFDEENVSESRDIYFDDVSNKLEQKYNEDISTNFYTDISLAEMKWFLEQSEIFIIHTHGTVVSLWISAEEDIYITDIEELNLSGMKLALLLACQTGIGFSQDDIDNNVPGNVVETMVCQGAETVVGFVSNVTIKDCNQFAKDFIQKMVAEGCSVEEAFEEIDYSDYDDDLNTIKAIGGNKNLELN